MISAFLIKKYYTTVPFKVLKPIDYTKIKRPHVHVNVLTFTSQCVCSLKRMYTESPYT